MRKINEPLSDALISVKPQDSKNAQRLRNRQENMGAWKQEDEFLGRSPSLPLTRSQERQLMLRIEELAQIEGLRGHRARAKIPSTTQALLDSKADDLEALKRDGSVVLSGPFVFEELSADPDNPSEGHAVIWMSDGTDSGDDGDIMIKVTAGEITKTATLLDFSAI